MPEGIQDFATDVLKKPLYPYQVEIANAILDSIYANRGDIITVMLSRQSGKNQLSAILEAYLLDLFKHGNIVKAAPTYMPQVINSRRRLMWMLENETLSSRIWTSWGLIGLAPGAQPGTGRRGKRQVKRDVKRHVGPAVQFFSAEPNSNVVGATASILLEIDEAQDVDPEKFDKDFRPMASTTNATTVLYGTSWSDDTLLAHQIASNKELEEQTGRKLNFAYDWTTLAEINANYKKYVESEIKRLGLDHITIKTQYLLQAVSGAGKYFSPMQLLMLKSMPHVAWEMEPDQDGIYIAGIDVAGEERPNPDGTPTKDRDSTVISIGKVSWDESIELHVCSVVHHEWWTGMKHTEQYAAIIALTEAWNLRRIVADYTGLGQGLVSWLIEKFGEERVIPYTFSRPAKSKIGHQLTGLVNNGRIKIYTAGDYPRETSEECWKQMRLARYDLPAPGIINFYVAIEDGHDDFLISLALLGEALQDFAPAPEEALIKPRRLYDDETSRF